MQTHVHVDGNIKHANTYVDGNIKHANTHNFKQGVTSSRKHEIIIREKAPLHTVTGGQDSSIHSHGLP